MRETMEDFLSQSGVSAVSLVSYRRDLEKLFAHFDSAPEKAGEKELSSYFSDLGKVLSAPSLTRHVSVVRSYYEFLKKEGILLENPVSSLRAASFGQKMSQALTEEEFSRLLSYSPPGFRGMRDRVMLSLLAETGMRVTELVELDQGDFCDGAITCGAGKRRRVLSLSPRLSAFLERYRTVSRLYACQMVDREPLFITAKGARLTRQGFWKNLKDYAIYSGVDKPISPQMLRRSLALHLMEEGKDREEIRLLLGNADTASLRGYKLGKKE